METDEASGAQAACGLARGDAGMKRLTSGVQVSALMIRYVELNAQATTLLVSYWPDHDRQRVQNVWIHTNPSDVTGTLRLFNALRKLVYVFDKNTIYRMNGFYPYVATYIKYKIDTDVGPAKFERTPIGRVWHNKYILLDEEGVNVFAEDNHEVIEEWFKFQTETDGHSTEKIYFHGPMGFVSSCKHSPAFFSSHCTVASVTRLRLYCEKHRQCEHALCRCTIIQSDSCCVSDYSINSGRSNCVL